VLILKLGAFKYKIFLESFLNKIKILRKFLIYLYFTNNSLIRLFLKTPQICQKKAKHIQLYGIC